MKRKLLSLTLVLALVLSLVPMSAFAAANQYTTAQSFSVDKTSVVADGTSVAEFSMYVRDASNATTSAAVYVVSSRGVETIGASVTTPSVATDIVAVTPDSNGKVVVQVASGVVGTSKIGFFLTTAAYADMKAFLNGYSSSTVNATTLEMVASKDITFTADSAKNYSISKSTSISGGATNPIANKVDYYEVSYFINSTSGAPVAGQKVYFYSSNSDMTFNVDSVETDATGRAKVRAYATKAGTYTLSAKFSNTYMTDQNLTFDASGVSALELVSSNNAKKANTSDQVKFQVKLIDVNGNRIDLTTQSAVDALTATTPSVFAKVDKEPTGSDVKGKISFTYYEKDLRVIIDPTGDFKEGDYSIKVYSLNGKAIVYNFTAMKQGAITKINFTYDDAVVPYGEVVSNSQMTLEQVDAAGIASSANTNDFAFSSSDNAVASVNSSGVVTFVNNKDNVGKEVTITATDIKNKLVGSFKMTVGGMLSTIKATAPDTATAAGKQAAVKVQFVDSNGKVAVVTTDATITMDAYVLEKPADSIVSTEFHPSFDGGIKTGGSTIYVASNKEGTAKVQIVVGVGSTKYSTVAEVKFGAATLVASKTVVLTIGSKTGFNNNAPVTSDLAPFIQDGRTFVPVSFIAAQLGGTAEFTKNAAGLVDTVTVKVGATTVTMTIGSTTIKVVKDGKESTVTSDVAPFIKSGRTVLPFRAVAEAFGAKVSFGPETGAVEWVKFEM